MRSTRLLSAATGIVLAGALGIGVAAAAPGDLDATFGVGGKVVAQLGSSASAIALQPDGKIVAVGGNTLARFNSSGSLDQSFASNGSANTGLSVRALALQPDGKAVVAGSVAPAGYCCTLAVARYTTSGNPDATFGTAGTVTTALGGMAGVSALAIQPDGKIVAVGSVLNPVGSSGFVVARYTADGSLDSSFGSGGVVVHAFVGATDRAAAVALDTAGKIVVSGAAGGDFRLARFNSDGTPDTTFGGTGSVATDFGGASDAADALTFQPDGLIIAAGVGNERFALARYQANGSLDATFGAAGRVTTQFFGENIESANAVAIQPNGKIVAAGEAFSSYDPSYALARYAPDGTLDATFGTGGKLTTDFGNPGDVGVLCPAARKDCSEDIANALAIQRDGKIIAAGGGGACIPSCVWTLARYQGDTVDSTPPKIATPSGIITNATSPAGATVSYVATAVDDTDGPVPVNCTPSSGAAFAMGDTMVACTAVDAAGNRAAANFTVHVKGATEQLADLAHAVNGVGPGGSLSSKVAVAQVDLALGDPGAASHTLGALILELRAQVGKTIPAPQAAALTNDAQRIKNVICTTS